MGIRKARGKAWGNALGGWRKQRRNANGQFGGGTVSAAKRVAKANKKMAKSKYKATKKRNNRSHRNRVKGSAKARVTEVKNLSSMRAVPYAVGAAALGYAAYQRGGSKVERSFGGGSGVDRYVKSKAAAQFGTAAVLGGVGASVVKTRQSTAFFNGLRKSQNARAKYEMKIAKKNASISVTNAKRSVKGRPPKKTQRGLTQRQWQERREIQQRRRQVIATVGRSVAGAASTGAMMRF